MHSSKSRIICGATEPLVLQRVSRVLFLIKCTLNMLYLYFNFLTLHNSNIHRYSIYNQFIYIKLKNFRITCGATELLVLQRIRGVLFIIIIIFSHEY